MRAMCAALIGTISWLWHAISALWHWSADHLPSFAGKTAEGAVSLATVLALGVAWWQLTLDRRQATGRVLSFNAWRREGQSEEPDGVLYELCEATVELIGNHTLEAVSVHVEVDGAMVQIKQLHGTKPFQAMPTLTRGDKTVTWPFYLPVNDIPKAWCVLSWQEPRNGGLRTQAVRQRLDLTDTAIYEWRWFIWHQQRLRFRRWAGTHGPRLFRRIFGAPRPLGKYEQVRNLELRDGEGPFQQP